MPLHCKEEPFVCPHSLFLIVYDADLHTIVLGICVFVAPTIDIDLQLKAVKEQCKGYLNRLFI